MNLKVCSMRDFPLYPCIHLPVFNSINSAITKAKNCKQKSNPPKRSAKRPQLQQTKSPLPPHPRQPTTETAPKLQLLKRTKILKKNTMKKKRRNSMRRLNLDLRLWLRRLKVERFLQRMIWMRSMRLLLQMKTMKMMSRYFAILWENGIQWNGWDNGIAREDCLLGVVGLG
jgi:hypothetical protein